MLAALAVAFCLHARWLSFQHHSDSVIIKRHVTSTTVAFLTMSCDTGFILSTVVATPIGNHVYCWLFQSNGLKHSDTCKFLLSSPCVSPRQLHVFCEALTLTTTPKSPSGDATHLRARGHSTARVAADHRRQVLRWDLEKNRQGRCLILESRSGSPSFALGCARTIITIRWRIYIMMEIEGCGGT